MILMLIYIQQFVSCVCVCVCGDSFTHFRFVWMRGANERIRLAAFCFFSLFCQFDRIWWSTLRVRQVDSQVRMQAHRISAIIHKLHYTHTCIRSTFDETKPPAIRIRQGEVVMLQQKERHATDNWLFLVFFFLLNLFDAVSYEERIKKNYFCAAYGKFATTKAHGKPIN